LLSTRAGGLGLNLQVNALTVPFEWDHS
jgi:SNF2 family DNA or RNA helicase